LAVCRTLIGQRRQYLIADVIDELRDRVEALPVFRAAFLKLELMFQNLYAHLKRLELGQ
jgi:hypothetical protein